MTHYDINGILSGAENGALGPLPSIHPAHPLHMRSKAIPDIDDTVVITPGLALAFYNAGIARRYLRDFDGAIQEFELVLRLDPTHQGAKFELMALRGATA